MTSRARRIVLAMYGHTPQPVAARVVNVPAYLLTAHGCYEAMDEPDETLVVTRGNFGLPCA